MTPWQTDPKGTHPPRKNVFGCTERKSTLLRVSCERVEGTKKARKGTTSPIYSPHLPFSAAAIICMWGRTVDVITRARFQVNRFSGFGAPGPGAENDPHPLTWHIALTTVYALILGPSTLGNASRRSTIQLHWKNSQSHY